MIPQEKIEQAAYNEFYKLRHGEPDNSYLHGFDKGVRFAESELKDLACEFAEWIDNFGYRQIGNSVWCIIGNIHRTTAELFTKFLEERSGNICCRCGELGATEKHGMCKKCIDFCQIK